MIYKYPIKLFSKTALLLSIVIGAAMSFALLDEAKAARTHSWVYEVVRTSVISIGPCPQSISASVPVSGDSKSYIDEFGVTGLAEYDDMVELEETNSGNTTGPVANFDDPNCVFPPLCGSTQCSGSKPLPYTPFHIGTSYQELNFKATATELVGMTPYGGSGTFYYGLWTCDTGEVNYNLEGSCVPVSGTISTSALECTVGSCADDGITISWNAVAKDTTWVYVNDGGPWNQGGLIGSKFAGSDLDNWGVGTYTFQLKANDGFDNEWPLSGYLDTVTVTVVPLANPPTAEAGLPHSLTEGNSHAHSGAKASHPEGVIKSYYMSFTLCPAACPSLSGASGMISGGSATISGPTYTPNLAGNYSLQLTVTDAAGLTGTDTVTEAAVSAFVCPDASIDEVNGQKPPEPEHSGVNTDDTYIIIRGTFSDSGNTVRVDGSIRSPDFQSATQINVPITLSAGSHTVEVINKCDNSSGTFDFTVTAVAEPTHASNLSRTVPACSSSPYTADLSWSGSGSGWYVDISTDSGFSTFSNKDVSNQTSTQAPAGFSGGLTLQPGTTYYWRVWDTIDHHNGASWNVPTCAVPTLSVTLSAATDSLNWTNSLAGNAPLNGVDLRADVSGTATGNIRYRFDCTNDGTYERDVTNLTDPYTAVDLCNYASVGTYTARVRADRQGVFAEDTTSISVTSAAVPTLTLSPNPMGLTVGGTASDFTLTYDSDGTGPNLSQTVCTGGSCFLSGSGWSSVNPLVAVVTSTGRTTAFSDGTTLIFANYSGLTVSATVNVGEGESAETLFTTLTADPNSGTDPLNSTLKAAVSGTATGTINYSFWWNCTSISNIVSVASSICGSLPAPVSGSCMSNSNGYKCDGVNTNPQLTPSHTYSPAGTYSSKVIVERGIDLSAESRTFIRVLVSSNQLPSASSVTITQPVYCVSGPAATVNWTYSDPDGDSQSAYQVQVDDVASAWSSPLTIDTGKVSGSGTSYFTGDGIPPWAWNTAYKARVRVWDSQGAVSNWTESSSWTTPKHSYPSVDFSWSPISPSANRQVDFTDLTQFFDGGGTRTWNWLFKAPSPSPSSPLRNPAYTYADPGLYNVNLTATDKDGYACSRSKPINIDRPTPIWEEVSPK